MDSYVPLLNNPSKKYTIINPLWDDLNLASIWCIFKWEMLVDIHRYSIHWTMERLGIMTPIQIRDIVE
jgi:hypothetical protein